MTQPVASSDFRNAMSRLGAAVNVITTDGPAGLHGLTASAVCSVTDNPPTVLVCVNQTNRAHAALSDNGVLCVNVLTSHHEDLSGLFGRQGVEVAERFGAGEWQSLSTGAPALKDAAASLDTRIVKTETIGTHTVFFCEVVAIKTGGEPDALIYFNRAYHHLPAEPSSAA